MIKVRNKTKTKKKKQNTKYFQELKIILPITDSDALRYGRFAGTLRPSILLLEWQLL